MTIAHKNYLDSLSVPMKDSTSSDEENEDQPLAELSTPKESRTTKFASYLSGRRHRDVFGCASAR